MSYLSEFQNRISNRDVSRSLELWKEFCEVDSVEEGELSSILNMIRSSDIASHFGQQIELALPLILSIADKKEQLDVFSLLFDIQTTNSQALWDLLQKILKENFGQDPLFSEKLRITGLRTKGSFQGALSNFLLLNHLMKDNFVYHKGGWGVGKILDCSFLREQISVEFENVAGSKKDLPFKTAFKSVQPLPKDHFFSLRFSAPNVLEEMALQDSVSFVKKIIEELGPKTASEIKDLVSGYILDEDDYSKWWQVARAKVKKDPLIISPEAAKEPFSLRKTKLSLLSRVEELFASKNLALADIWALIRDFPQVTKDLAAKSKIEEELQKRLRSPSISFSDRIQLAFINELLDEKNQAKKVLSEDILSLAHPIATALLIDIIAFRKRFLQLLQEVRSDWKELFQEALLKVDSLPIKEYLSKELASHNALDIVEEVFENVLEHPLSYPETFLWAFQKTIDKESLVLTQQRDLERFFESFLLLLSAIENKPERRELAKKMHALLTGHRFKIVRELFQYTDIPFIQEFLLLASKCQSLSEHDVKILRSLAEVAHPDLSEKKEESSTDDNILWTTAEGHTRTQDRIKHIGTIEIIDNAKEIEAARALGDLRENAEYKFALERRSRLQSELKMLSDQFHRARILTKEDVDTSKVSVGTRVLLKDANGKEEGYLILGPWDANVEKNILSFQSKLAQAMLGKKVGEKVSFKGDLFVVQSIKSYFS